MCSCNIDRVLLVYLCTSNRKVQSRRSKGQPRRTIHHVWLFLFEIIIYIAYMFSVSMYIFYLHSNLRVISVSAQMHDVTTKSLDFIRLFDQKSTSLFFSRGYSSYGIDANTCIRRSDARQRFRRFCSCLRCYRWIIFATFRTVPRLFFHFLCC